MSNFMKIKLWYQNYLQFMKTFFNNISKLEIFLFVLLNTFLSLYIVFTRYVVYSTIFISKIHTLYCLIFSLFLCVIVFNIIIYICWKLRNFKIQVSKEKSKLSLKLFITCFTICFLILFISLLAY